MYLHLFKQIITSILCILLKNPMDILYLPNNGIGKVFGKVQWVLTNIE